MFTPHYIAQHKNEHKTPSHWQLKLCEKIKSLNFAVCSFYCIFANGFSRKRARPIRFRGKKYKRLLFIHKTFRNLQVEEQYTE